jgi:hypothetical protein
MLLGELPTLPIGLCASGEGSPVALRAAAVRDHDIFAVVCRGGLIDLAGMLYLRSLTSPLLVLVAADDERVAASNRRALRELRCDKELKLLPASSEQPDSARGLRLRGARDGALVCPTPGRTRGDGQGRPHHLSAPAGQTGRSGRRACSTPIPKNGLYCAATEAPAGAFADRLPSRRRPRLACSRLPLTARPAQSRRAGAPRPGSSAAPLACNPGASSRVRQHLTEPLRR